MAFQLISQQAWDTAVGYSIPLVALWLCNNIVKRYARNVAGRTLHWASRPVSKTGRIVLAVLLMAFLVFIVCDNDLRAPATKLDAVLLATVVWWFWFIWDKFNALIDGRDQLSE